MRRRRHGAPSRALTTVPLPTAPAAARRPAPAGAVARRAAAVVLGLTGFAAVAGCTSVPAAPVGAPAPTGSTVRATPSPSGNTSAVCQQINAAVAGDLTAFGTDVGTFAGHLAEKNTTGAGKAKSAALGRLNGLAGKIRTAGQQASEARVGAAAAATAGNLEALAADPALLANVHTATDVPPVISRVTLATDPMVNACV